MPVQAKCQTFEAEDRVTQMNSVLKLVFFIHKGEGISLCKHEPCVDVNVIRVRALQVSITAGFLFLLKTSYVNKSFHIFLISLIFY